MLILHDMAVSGNCYKVRLLLHMLGIPFTSKAIEPSSGESSAPEFLLKNPNASVPFLEFENGRYLAESNAILLHLSEGTPFLPEGSWERAKVYEWLFFEQYSHEPAIAVRISLCSVAARAHLATPERMSDLLKRGQRALSVMENRLENCRYFAGDAFSIADIALYAYTHKAGTGGFDLDGYPKIRDWLYRVENQPDFVAIDWMPPL